jgi:pyruvate dehydrogenase E2 component (dihydrolipoamide acetyltransferase)
LKEAEMAEKVMMIALSPTMEEGSIVSWSKQEGDKVSSGDVICEVETDKASMDYESTQEGTLLKIVVGDGKTASVGETIAILGEEGEDISGLLEEATAAPEKDPATTVPVEAREEPQAPPQVPPRQQPQQGRELRAPGVVKASPLARTLARERGVDLSQVSGTGPGGRVVKRDVESFTPAERSTGPSVFATGGGGVEEADIPVSRKRAVKAPHFYIRMSAFTEGLMAARKRLNERLPEKVSLNAFLMKLAAESIKRNPVVNQSWMGETIHQHGSIDIGLAVAVPDGLITPVVRDCGRKGIVQMDRELSPLIEKARTGKLAPEEYTGATFTVSNLGSYGVDEFTAIINPPGSAILALGAMKKEPVVDESDQIVVRQVLRMTLSCDHRVIDGAKGAEFLATLRDMIQDPIQALY